MKAAIKGIPMSRILIASLSLMTSTIAFGCEESPATNSMAATREQPAEGKFTHKQWLSGHFKPKSTLKE